MVSSAIRCWLELYVAVLEEPAFLVRSSGRTFLLCKILKRRVKMPDETDSKADIQYYFMYFNALLRRNDACSCFG